MIKNKTEIGIAGKTRIGIIGSCVSRDPFELQKDNYQIEPYIARSSFASMFGEPFDKSVPLEMITSPWQRNMIDCDIRKLARPTIVKSNLDLMVIDFIDERFGLLSSDGTFATLSLSLSEVMKGEYENSTVIRNGSEQYRSLWAEGWEEFVKIARSTGLSEKCVLHKVRWASVDSMGNPFSESLVNAGNRNLEWCYQLVEATFPEIKIIEIPRDLLIGDAEHKWGPAPYHYIKSAQTYFLEALESLVRA